MPVITGDMENHNLAGSNYGFSAKRVDTLGATEYTLVGIASDCSGSVEDFASDIESCVLEIIKSCKYSPRADNLMLRLMTFNDNLREVHGFKPLADCEENDYKGKMTAMGKTSLYDAVENVVASVAQYGKELSENDFSCNGIVFVITDGEDVCSSKTVNDIKKSLNNIVKGEFLESLVSVLVGVNVNNSKMSNYLKEFKDQAGFTQYIEIDKANAKSLAKLASFISKSISAQSQSLGSGKQAQSLSF